MKELLRNLLKCLSVSFFNKTDWVWVLKVLYSLFINELNSRWSNNWLISSPSQRYDYDISFDDFLFIHIFSKSPHCRCCVSVDHRTNWKLVCNVIRNGENLSMCKCIMQSRRILRWSSSSGDDCITFEWEQMIRWWSSRERNMKIHCWYTQLSSEEIAKMY